jgi:hypothetical protein
VDLAPADAEDRKFSSTSRRREHPVVVPSRGDSGKFSRVLLRRAFVEESGFAVEAGPEKPDSPWCVRGALSGR